MPISVFAGNYNLLYSIQSPQSEQIGQIKMLSLNDMEIGNG